MTGNAGETRRHRPRKYGTAVERWASVGPYYAMFPLDFAYDVINEYSRPGDRVLDPFVGRGSSIYAAGASGRIGCGIELSPVGWVYSTVKLRPATPGRVLQRLRSIASDAAKLNFDQVSLPVFFKWAYSNRVLRFLLTARDRLHWRTCGVDRTLMAFILIYLHGKLGSSLSNQMRDSKAMAPDYAVRWWKAREMKPPDLDPVAFIEKRIEWRYKKGHPRLPGEVLFGDSVQLLSPRSHRRAFTEPFDLLFTSPPYCGVTNYHYDQWLRLWMLGQIPSPRRRGGRWHRKFESRSDYRQLLSSVFQGAAQRMHRDSVVVVRTDARDFTLAATVDALEIAFPTKQMDQVRHPVCGRTQTALYGDSSTKPGEVQLVMAPR